MDKWLRERLSHCLQFDVPDDMVKYVMTLKNSDEFDEYFSSLLDPSIADHSKFMTDCKQRLFSKALPNKKANNQSQQPSKNQTNKKQDKPTAAAPTSGNKKQDKLPSASNAAPTAGNKKQDKPTAASTAAPTAINKSSSVSTAAPTAGSGGKKQKPKYVNLFTNDGKIPNVVMLKGRRHCDCYATEHNLINNCLNCGRVVCEQEGSGPCLFCGELVCTNEELELIKNQDENGENLKKTLEERGREAEGLKKALEHRDRLLEFDRDGIKRTQVIDDEDDYFEENSGWHSTEDREKFQRLKQEMHDKRHAPQSQRQIKMDLFGREVFEEAVPEDYEARVRKEMAEAIAQSNRDLWSNQTFNKAQHEMNIDPTVDFKPMYVPTDNESGSAANRDFCDINATRIQDKQSMELVDLRRCISMHQPYASLLVYGVKKHEGRTWYSGHRGRLWIASTVKVPTREEVNEVENFYKQHYKGLKLKFPSQYQTSCILGCVHIDDVLTQEEYRKKFPDGESESPYVFICKSPKILPVVFPHSGSHKIYQLDPNIHKAASMALLRKKNDEEENLNYHDED